MYPFDPRFEDLANEIIIQAVEDKATAICKQLLARDVYQEAQKTIDEVDGFFEGKKLRALTDNSIEKLNEAALKKGQYKYFRKVNKCGICGCNQKECPWRTEKNWLMFSRTKNPTCKTNKEKENKNNE